MFAPFPRPPRPLGVAILAILEIIIGVIDILVGIVLLFGFFFAVSIFGFGMYAGFELFLLPLALFLLIFGLFAFILAFGLWSGQGWAWVLSIILAVIGLVVSLVGLLLGSFVNIIPLALYAIILLYLNTYHVRAFFGRAPPLAIAPYPGYPPPMPPPVVPAPPAAPAYYAQPPIPPPMPPQAAYPPPVRQGFMSRRTTMCPSCLSPLPPGALSCPRCGAQFR